MTLHRLASAPCQDDGSFLLPGGDGGPAVVLFWRGKATANRGMRAMFERTRWPRGYRACVLEVERAHEVMAFFGIRADDAVAVIDDGVILALEYDCDEQACRRLLATAERARSYVSEL